MKRIYRAVATESAPGGHAVTLDGKRMRTPGRRELLLPTSQLAAAIAAEWDAQVDEVRPAQMPLTRLAATAIDRTADQRDQTIAQTADYAGTDLVCYRADHPPVLAERQHAAWQPLLDWAAERYASRLEATAGIVPKRQSPSTLARFTETVATYDNFRLTGLHTATAACGSLIIALALAEGRLDAAEAFALSQLDETFQIEAWGEDAEAKQRREALAADIQATARFLGLLAE
ncbi:MAG TPA: ATP12 family protein [Stellaceae bacterium]|jgi:chaperone required for assembly of F1-ATPase